MVSKVTTRLYNQDENSFRLTGTVVGNGFKVGVEQYGENRLLMNTYGVFIDTLNKSDAIKRLHVYLNMKSGRWGWRITPVIKDDIAQTFIKLF